MTPQAPATAAVAPRRRNRPLRAGPLAAGELGKAVIQLASAGKRYTKYEDAPTLLGRALSLRSGARRSELWAVRNLDLEVRAGETVGVIGRNGAGKSTLLRMLAGVTSPTEGTVAVRGRVAPLISIGVGFHPELTGRENVFVNGTVLGMTRQETERRFEQIVEFADLASFIDTPVKFYSSGMFVRLGFSVAVAARPAVLLVDEVLAVGDLAFQMKCFERMRALQAEGATIVVVSHNLNAVRMLCERALVLAGGTPRFLGGADEAIARYHDLLDAPDAPCAPGGAPGEGPNPVVVERFELAGADGPTAHVASGEELVFSIGARFRQDVEHAAFTLAITSETGVTVYADSNYGSACRFRAGESASCEVRLPAWLTTGSYSARAGVMWAHDSDSVAHSRPLLFYVAGRHLVGGYADLGASFTVSR